jgi:hypothetical protein
MATSTLPYQKSRTKNDSKQTAFSADMTHWIAISIFETSQFWICVVQERDSDATHTERSGQRYAVKHPCNHL